MSLTQAEILDSLGLTGKSPARAVVELAKLELDDAKNALLFRQFAGDDAEMPASRLLRSVVAYLVVDAASGLPLDVAGCMARTERLAAAVPYNFSDAAEAERQAAKAEARAEREAKAEAKKVVVVDAEGNAVPRRRGRPAAVAGESTYDKVKALYDAAVDKSKETLLPMLQDTLGLSTGTATVYWYKAKKEVAVA